MWHPPADGLLHEEEGKEDVAGPMKPVTLARSRPHASVKMERDRMDEQHGQPGGAAPQAMDTDVVRSHPLEVRVAELGDAGVVAQMLHDFNLEFDAPTPGPSLLAERLRPMLSRDDVVVLLAGDPAAGVALLTFRASVWDSGPVALLEELYVQPDVRRHGIGHTLLERAVALAEARGSQTFEINVDEGDADARRFYEAHGFSDLQPETNERALYYSRSLAAPTS
jgi:GNAT superfamily N-acetyltransferase